MKENTKIKLGKKIFEGEWRKALAAGYKGSKKEFMKALLHELKLQKRT